MESYSVMTLAALSAAQQVKISYRYAMKLNEMFWA